MQVKASFSDGHFEGIMGIRDEDRAIYSFYKLRHIKSVIGLHLVPSLDECRAQLVEDNYSVWNE
jgi:hypothetical protein